MRTFIALDISEEARAEAGRIEKVLKDSGADVKWVKPDSIHLTLKFLGNIPEDRVGPLGAVLDEIASVNEPFDAVLHDLGVFPRWDYPRVVWIGLNEGADRVKKIARSVEDAMFREGFSRENRPFSPHITIGRVRTVKNKDKLKKIAADVVVSPVPSRMDRITLYRSELSPKGSVYTPLYIAHLCS